MTLAVQILKLTINAVHDEYKIPSRACHEVFGQFQIDHIAKTWNEASRLLEPRAHEIVLEDIEQKNINQGLQQILEQWGDPVAQVSSVVLNIQEYEEVFRTKGEMKKALRSLRETRDGIRDFIEQDRNSFLLHKMQQQQDGEKDYD